MEQWTDVRRAVLVEKISKRAACRRFGLHWDTLKRILEHPVPPGYLRKQAAQKALIAAWLGRLKELVEANGVVPMLADWTDQSPTIKKALNDLGCNSIPVLAIWPAGPEEKKPIVLSDLLLESQVLDALKRAGPSKRK